MDAWSRPHRAGLASTTKMLVSLLVLLASVLLAVESHGLSIVDCAPHERGTLLTEESWSCSNGDSSCTSTFTDCFSNGSGQQVGGSSDYSANGSLIKSMNRGWDCILNQF